MKVIRLNLAVYNVMYKAGKEADYHVIKDLLNSLEIEEVYWLVTSRLSLLRSFRTKDFYKIFSRFIIETIQEALSNIQNKDSEESIKARNILQEEIVKLTSAIFNTTESDKVKSEFTKHLFTSRAIFVKEMIPYSKNMIKPFLMSNTSDILIMDNFTHGFMTQILITVNNIKSDLEVFRSVIDTIEN